MNELALCAGYDGLGLGLRLASAAGLCGEFRTVCYVEREAFAAANLVKKIKDGLLDDAPVWSDVDTFDGAAWRGAVDIITAGFPCQPWSAAGKKQGVGDERWLWPSILKIIRNCRPEYVFLENVPGLLRGGIQRVLWQLSKIGYDAEWDVFSAAGSGAWHKRQRVFILAHAGFEGSRARGGAKHDGCRYRERSAKKKKQKGSSLEPFIIKNGQAASDADSAGCKQQRGAVAVREELEAPECDSGWPTEPEVGRVANGYPGRVDELRLCGNGVVPVVAARAYITLKGRLAA